MRAHDAIVIGGGPAGATAALALARRGWSVALLEKSRFPRPKVCGEYVSPSGWSALRALEAARGMEALAGPPVRRVGLFALEHAIEVPMPSPSPGAPWGRALGRESLDTMLVEEAARAGVQVLQPCAALALRRVGRWQAVAAEDDEGPRELYAPIVVAAHGSWEPGRLPTQLARPARSPGDLLGFKARFRGGRLADGLMPLVLFPGGYGGLVESDDGCVSFSCCIRRDALFRVRAARRGTPAGDAVLAHASASARALREALAGARREGPWLATGPIRPGIRKQPGAGLFRVGNAAGEAHPLVAEGIGMAIQSGWLLAETVGAHRRLLDEAELDAIGRAYERRWRAHFAPRVRASHAFAWATGRALHAATAAVTLVPAILAWGARWSGKAAPMPEARALSRNGT
ncbi:MAG TPA: FAD-dependent oxidoreductase [Usitatibacter sp.]|nr:FAD-dependent oxidoreductase [Usitatibacter sp.]